MVGLLLIVMIIFKCVDLRDGFVGIFFSFRERYCVYKGVILLCFFVEIYNLYIYMYVMSIDLILLD